MLIEQFMSVLTLGETENNKWDYKTALSLLDFNQLPTITAAGHLTNRKVTIQSGLQ